ncbi:lytic transglycosylase domain-containing protein [Micromonospora ureilytica]|uniref:Lytic transglycosylase domain-containing protein n=1 Tax=Micromonospora ureilytica TaxID=709868 RepID=A0A3N9XYW2_9ACTN|nr:lytic transglycosylase domain-containing protein [Micromonospora ureilytica]RQX18291.1 lytic transglycosylase domain-containing protein [Micromonospora ureilytica]
MSGSPKKDSGSQKSYAVLVGAAIAAATTCLMSPVAVVVVAGAVLIIGGLGVLLFPLIVLIIFFTGLDGSDSGDAWDRADESMAAFEGDGKGTLDRTQVPASLADTIEDAGAVCTSIGPIVIAAQIEVESDWDGAKVGADGELGISQLPPAVFDRHGKDTDKNDKTSALDQKDSIMAQARYLCALADEAQGLIDSGEAIGSALDLALVAYDQGMDAVREAGGIPATAEAQGYVAKVRARFGQYQGLGGPPPSFPSASPS